MSQTTFRIMPKTLTFDRLRPEADARILADVCQGLGLRVTKGAAPMERHRVVVDPGDEEFVLDAAAALGLGLAEDPDHPKARYPEPDVRPDLCFSQDGKKVNRRAPVENERELLAMNKGVSCAAKDPHGWLCTRPPDHEGDHIAGAGPQVIVARWAKETK